MHVGHIPLTYSILDISDSHCELYVSCIHLTSGNLKLNLHALRNSVGRLTEADDRSWMIGDRVDMGVKHIS